MSAACVHARRNPHDVTAVELAHAFCRQARVRVDDLFDHLWRNTDDSDRQLARDVLADRFTWLEEGVLDPSIEGPWTAQQGDTDGRGEKVHRCIR